MLQRALVVDDSVVFHKLIKTHLDGEDLEFHSAFDGESGLTMAADIHPSLILLDVDMPDMDGFEVCQMIRAQFGKSRPRIVALTGFPSEENRLRIIEAGADCCLEKTAPIEALLRELGVAHGNNAKVARL